MRVLLQVGTFFGDQMIRQVRFSFLFLVGCCPRAYAWGYPNTQHLPRFDTIGLYYLIRTPVP